MRNILFIGFIVLNAHIYSQGIINNGAQITFSGGGQIYVDGGANGNYLSQSGGIVNPSATGIISIEGDWTNNSANTGFGNDNGTVIFTGANQSILGSNSTTFYNLTLQGTGIKTQNLNTSVGGVSTTNGVLSVGNVVYDLNSFVLTVTNPVPSAVTYGSGYVLSETNAAVNPSIMRWNMGTSTGAHVYPFGVAGNQIPLTFNKTNAATSDVDVSTRSTAASDNAPWAGMSNVAGVSFFYCPNNGMAGNNCAANSVIDRWWDITPSASTTANVTFSYLGSENTLNAPYNTGNIGAQFWDGTYWNMDNATIGNSAAVNVGVGNITANGLTQFCPYVLSSVLVPLPVELINFSAVCSDDNTVLNWSTATERNSSHFDIMNSEDGVSFKKIAMVKAAGNSTELKKYSYAVENKKQFGKYFRLKTIDTDLTARSSDIRFADESCGGMEQAPNLYFNPQTGIVVNAFSKNAADYTLNIVDVSGRIISTNALHVNSGYNTLSVQPDLANGVYLVQLMYTDGQSVSKKIVLGN